MIDAISYFNPWADKGTLRDLDKVETWQKVGAVVLSGIEAIVIVAVSRQVSSMTNHVLVPIAGLCAFATFRAVIERAASSKMAPPPKVEMTANRIFWGVNYDRSVDSKAFRIKVSLNGADRVLYGYVEAGNKVTIEKLLDDVVTKFKTSHGLDVEGKEFHLSYAGKTLPLGKPYLGEIHETTKYEEIRLFVRDKKSTSGIVWSSDAPPTALSFCIKATATRNVQVLHGYVEAGSKLNMQMLMDAAVEKFSEKGLAVEGKKFRLLYSQGQSIRLETLFSDLHEQIKRGYIWLVDNPK